MMFVRAFRNLVTLLFLLACATGLPAQTVDFTLDLYYNDPTDTNSAGVWELVALASDRGLAGTSVRLQDVVSPTITLPMFMAPNGTAAGIAEVGFRESFGGGAISFATDQGDHARLLFNQVPTSPPGPQGLLYDVGVLGGATQPGENGTPPIAGFVGNNTPWNYDDLLGDFLDDGINNNSGAFHDGVLLALGMFDANTSPDFYALEATTANVFTAIGTATDPPPAGSILEASVSLTVRDNTALLAGDANFDGAVDGQDFIIWNGNKFSPIAGYRNGDFNGDKFVDGQDFIIWNANKFTSVDATVVPEPASLALLLCGIFGVLSLRSERRQTLCCMAILCLSLLPAIVDDASAAEQVVGSDVADTMIAFDANSTGTMGPGGMGGAFGNGEEQSNAHGGLDFMTIRGGDPFNSQSLTAKPLVRFELSQAIDNWRPYFVEVTTNTSGNSNDTFRLYAIQDTDVQNFDEATLTWNNAPASATANSNNFNAAGPEIGIFFAPDPGQAGVKLLIPIMGSQISQFLDANTNNPSATFGFTSTEINRMEIRSREQAGGVDKPRMFSYDVQDSLASGNLTGGGTWAGGAPTAANFYRVTAGHTVSVNGAAFNGEGVVVDNGTLDFAASGVDIPLIVLNAGGAITKSVGGSLEIGNASSSRNGGGLVLNRDFSYTAAAGEDLTIQLPLRSETDFTFTGNAGSDLVMQFPQGHRGELFFEGTANEIEISATSDEGIGGRWHMNSTGTNRMVFSGIDSEQEFGVGTLIFNQPGEIDHRSTVDRLQGMAYLEVNADLDVNLTRVFSGNERLLRLTRSLRGSANIDVNGTLFDPTSGGATLNEFEIGTTDGSDTNVSNASFSGTITTNNFVTIGSQIGIPAAKVIVNQNGKLTTGFRASPNATVDIGEIEIMSGGELNVGYVSPNSVPAAEAHTAQDLVVTNSSGRDGNLTLQNGALTRMQINGTMVGEFDRILVEGTGTIDGTLELLLNPFDNGQSIVYTPNLGDTFDIIFGTTGVASPADFNGDGTVDDLDYVIWDGALDLNADGDADGDGDTDGDDFLVWQRDFGMTATDGTVTGMFDLVTITDPDSILNLLGLELEVNYLPNLVQVEVVAGAAVPEPSAGLMGVSILILMAAKWRLGRRS